MSLQEKQPNPSLIAYQPQVDGLRFCAVFVVLFYHYIPMLQSVGGYTDLGIMLAFFFVLSSYLITKILLTGKDRTVNGSLTRSDVGIAFLVRRTLRIFPAYYCYLLILLLIPDSKAILQQSGGSYWYYLSNFHMFNHQYFGELTGHLWTLSVEEQFYLVWPWIVLFAPTRYLRYVFIGFIAAGIGARLLLFIQHGGDTAITTNILTPTCLDSFGFGALLAYDQHTGRTRTRTYQWLLAALIPVWLLSIFANLDLLDMVINRVLVALAAILVIAGAAKGYNNIVGRFLQSRPVLFMARISYGMYLYHLLAASLFWMLLGRFGATVHSRFGWDDNAIYSFFTQPVVAGACFFVLTLLMATASWYLVEKPANNLKRFFNYTNTAKRMRKSMAVPSAKQSVS